MFSVLGPKFCFDLLEVERLKARAWSTIDPGLVPNNLRSKRLGEPADWLTKISLEELDDRRWEVQLISALEDILLGELVRGQPLGKVTDNFGGRCDLILA